MLWAMPEKRPANREIAATNRRKSAAGARPRLAERRKVLGLTQEALARLVGAERSTIVRWERGESAPLPLIRPKLARALRVSADRLEELLTPGAPAGADPSGADPSGAEAGRRPRQLPPAVPGFTGRAAELAKLTKVLDDATAAAVVISAIGGTAGVGKSALASQWAHQAAGRFPDGQLYVNLRGYDPDRPMPPGDALAGFLRALGVAGPDIPPEEHERAARYRTLLAGRSVLVILDNAGSADQARPLLPGSPACAVVVTSRDSLAGLVARDGASRLDLDLLPPPDAVRLLRELIGDRAAADPGATSELSQRCCRLPLALRVAAELAVARPGVPLAELAGELADQQRLLNLLDAGGDPRTAVRSVFSWSYRHLDAGAARAFRLAGLYPAADFDVYAVAALTGCDLRQARKTLDRLSKAHLVAPTGTGRYAMHDLLRACAGELAATHDGDDGQRAALTRLFDYYLSTAATAMDALYPAERHQRPRVYQAATPAPPIPDDTAARSWLDGERAALTAVSQYAAAHQWAEHATRLSATLWRYLSNGGYYPEAIAIHTSAREAARQQGDAVAGATAANSLGVIDAQQGRFQLAIDRFLEARDLYREAGDRSHESISLGNLSAAYMEEGRYQEAIGSFEQALSASRRIGDRLGEAIDLGNLGVLFGRQGRYQQATEALQQSLDIDRETGDRHSECWTLISLGEIASMRADYQRADDLLGKGLAMSRADGYRSHEARALTKIGELRGRQGRSEAAAGHLREAIDMFGGFGDRAGEAMALNRLGEVRLAVGQPGDSRDQHAAALALAAGNGDRPEEARAHDGLGHAYHALGDADAADRHWRAAFALYTDMGVPQAEQIRPRLGGTSLRLSSGHGAG